MRKLPNFIQGIMQYTEDRGSPRLYRLWAAIFVVSALLERKVWVENAIGKLYPNQYIVLVGGAGIGKSLCTNIAYDLLESVRSPENALFIAPTSVTKASLIDALKKAERRIVRPMEIPAVVSFNSLIAIANEFGVFLPSWDNDFMAVLTDLWDCKRYSETRRTANLEIDIPNVQLNMLSATTPAHLMGLLPEGAWETGFMSRTLMVYSGEMLYTDIFAEFDFDRELYESLKHDAREIYKLWGEMQVSEEAVNAFRKWAKTGGAPRPDHPKLHYYCSRRGAHLLKLCMVACAADGDEMIITLDHFVEAMDWLIELESFMPDIFKSMKVGGDGRAIEDCWHFAYKLHMQDKKVIPEDRLWHFLQERVPAHSIERIIDVMVRAKLLEEKMTGTGAKGYIPKTRDT